MRYVLAFTTILLLCSCKDKNEQLDYSNVGKDSKSKSVNVSGLKDTVTAETNLGIPPTSIYKGLKYETACDSLVKIRKALGSFGELTEYMDQSVPKEQKVKIGNMGWETQNLGFSNWSNDVEATLMKQNFLIKKLEYELAKEQFESGKKVTKDNVSRLKETYESSEKTLADYLNAFTYAD